jgi:tripartite-type tricarboxylate transporter receptor subunit TctC
MLHFGLLAPAATPRSVIDRLNRELNALLALEDAKKRIAADGGDPFAGTPAEYEAYIARETRKWSALIRRLDLKLD